MAWRVPRKVHGKSKMFSTSKMKTIQPKISGGKKIGIEIFGDKFSIISSLCSSCYKGDCSCGVDYIGETVRNLAVRIAEHSNPAHTSEPAKHLREFHLACSFLGTNIPQA